MSSKNVVFPDAGQPTKSTTSGFSVFVGKIGDDVGVTFGAVDE